MCDCVHDYLGLGTHMFPLNVAYVAAYAKKLFSGDLDVKLFKYPKDLFEDFKRNPSHIVGLSNYAWSADLNSEISKWIKALSPETIVIFGGPNINYSSQGYRRFFATHDSADFYVLYEGEEPFANLMRHVFDKGLSLPALKHRPIDGVLFYDRDSDVVVQGQDLPRIKDLDEIPSPYLTGIMDKFFDAFLIPIMETSRGCPYTCTFCAQGMSSHNRVGFFNLERVKEDIGYIVSRLKNANMITFADANFGIAERDAEIAGYVAKLKEKNPFFRKVNVNWAKNQPKLFEMVRTLKDTNLVISLQSLDETVLKNIRRSNIKLSMFKDAIEKINSIGGVSGTEVILGLPGETKESHLQTIRQLFDWDVAYITCYNIIILDGTEMSLDRESGKFKGSVKYRLIDHSFGKYEDMVSFEVEEGIRSTLTMTEEDILFFRPVHWLIQFLWSYGFYFYLLKYLQLLQINPVDYIVRLIENIDVFVSSKKIRNIFSEFRREARAEWFDSPEDLRNYYSQPEQFKKLKEGNYGKMNFKYMFKVLLEAREDFEEYLLHTAVSYSNATKDKEQVLKDIMNFLSASIIDFALDWGDACQKRSIVCKYNIPEWRDSKYNKNLDALYYPKGIKYNFYLPDQQRRSLETLLKQYYNKNKNVTLRKMSEYIDFRDFFYKIAKHEEDCLDDKGGLHGKVTCRK